MLYNRRSRWTSMIRNDPRTVVEAGAYFDRVVARILAEDFAVRQVPEARVCGECDFRAYCQGRGTIRMRH
jgi:hypothetical protein